MYIQRAHPDYILFPQACVTQLRAAITAIAKWAAMALPIARATQAMNTPQAAPLIASVSTYQILYMYLRCHSLIQKKTLPIVTLRKNSFWHMQFPSSLT